MINLIGCSKEKFIKLLNLMEYKYEKPNNNNEEFFIYRPKKHLKIKKRNSNKMVKDNPFKILSSINFK